VADSLAEQVRKRAVRALGSACVKVVHQAMRVNDADRCGDPGVDTPCAVL
jgi:hypothetical protein